MGHGRRNIRSEVVAFFRRYVYPRGIAGSVHVTYDTTGKTIVRIEDAIPRPPFRPGAKCWRVTTVGTVLLSKYFGDEASRERINKNRNKARGRVVYCIDDRRLPLVAVSFHVDPRRTVPLLLTAVALRTDTDQAAAISEAAAGWVLAYLLEVARQDGRPHELAVELTRAQRADVFEAIGFRRAPPPLGYTPRAPDYRVFRAP